MHWAIADIHINTHTQTGPITMLALNKTMDNETWTLITKNQTI